MNVLNNARQYLEDGYGDEMQIINDLANAYDLLEDKYFQLIYTRPSIPSGIKQAMKPNEDDYKDKSEWDGFFTDSVVFYNNIVLEIMIKDLLFEIDQRKTERKNEDK